MYPEVDVGLTSVVLVAPGADQLRNVFAEPIVAVEWTDIDAMQKRLVAQRTVG